jgi:hypothetical protein
MHAWSILFVVTCVLNSVVSADPFGTSNLTGELYRVQGAGRVENGVEAIPHSHPYAVYVKDGNNYITTGVIFDQYTILTEGKSSSWDGTYRIVYAGKHHTTSFETTQQIREVCRFRKHPDYDGSKQWYSYGIIHLSDPLRFNSFVQAIPMAPQGFVPKAECTFAAWGKVSQGGGEPSSVLNEKNVTVIACQDSPHQTLLCGSPGSCVEDYGGALVCQDGSRVVLYGLGANIPADKCKTLSRYGNVANYPISTFLVPQLQDGKANCQVPQD